MKILRWILMVVLSGMGGYGLVQYLVSKPIEMSTYLTLTLVALIGLGWVIARLFSGVRLFLPIGASILVFVGAYLFTNSAFLNQEIEHPLPELIRQAGDPGDGHTAVIYFTHGEPPAYSPNAWIETIRHLDADGVPFVPKPFRPFFFNGVRSEYLLAGGSIHNNMHGHMIDSLTELMHAEDDPDLRFYLSFLDTDPRPDYAVIQALNNRASRIIIMPVFLTISSHTKEGLELVEQLDLSVYEVSLCVADPMWQSAALQEMFVARVNAYIGETDIAQVGIMLVGHGQPEEWDAIYPTQTEQENTFRVQVRDLLISQGYSPEKVVLAWMDFKSPTVTEGTLQLLDLGVEKILVIPVPISATSIHTDIEIPAAVEEAGLPEGVDALFLGAWNNDPLVIEGIRQNILNCD